MYKRPRLPIHLYSEEQAREALDHAKLTNRQRITLAYHVPALERKVWEMIRATVSKGDLEYVLNNLSDKDIQQEAGRLMLENHPEEADFVRVNVLGLRDEAMRVLQQTRGQH